jgi:N-acyl-D-aspartate/D-glutamate deacylase
MKHPRTVVTFSDSGARRLVQRSRGFAATIVNGEIVLRDGKPTGALPGQLLRGPLARR